MRCKLRDFVALNQKSYTAKLGWKYLYYLDTGNITKNVVDSYQKFSIPDKAIPSRAKRLVKNGTIIYSTVRPNQLHYGLLENIPNNLLVSTGFTTIDVNPKFADERYVFYFLTQESITKSLHALAEQSVSTYPSIKADDIGDIEIDLPPLETQKKISKLVSSIDEKIKLNKEINDNLLNQIDSHFRELYIDFEQNNGRIPDNFRYGILDELSKEIICGKTPSTKNESYYGGNIPFITIPDMHDKVYVIKTERYLSEEGANSQIKKFLPRNSICVSCIGTAGLVALVNESSHTNQQINSIIPKENISPYYVYSLMKTLKDKIISLGQCGSTIVNLNKVQFSKLEVLIPTEQSMSEFDQRVKPMFEQINLLQIENEKLSYLRDSLLPKLMSGEIDVDSIEL